MESIWDQLLNDKQEDQLEEKYNTKNKEKLDEIIDKNTTHFYTNLTLSEIKKRDIAFQIYSEYVDDTFWICSNDEMVEQMKIDDPESVVYHIDEIVRINKLKPDIKGLKSIHQVKKKFGNSKVVEINKEKY
jgi:hypothetical protein